MWKPLLASSLMLSIILADDNLTKLQYDGVEVGVSLPNGQKELVDIEREVSDDCLIDVPMKTKLIWGGDYASYVVPDECKVSFVSTIGKISPMSLHKDIETFGELEVLAFLQTMNSPEHQKKRDMLFIDSRAVNWYKHRTIPSAINMPFVYFRDTKKYAKEFEASLKVLGVKKVNDKYDFSEAKTALTFCNGAWCGQSPTMIRVLLKIGFPPKKIKWYRGGMQSWLGLAMTSTKGKVSVEEEKALLKEAKE
ncbi:MAG: rhodanese-like domain-containing protein [Epsilonproteobacteria bacterium]|nr:rhodanese-like domain-containing protein [Campylobacterota bacterium]